MRSEARPPIDRALACAAITCAALLSSAVLGGCDESPHALTWTIALGSGAARARTVVVHTEIRRGGCDGEPVFASEARPTDPADVPPELTPGRWGFAADAWSAECARIGTDCDEVTLPGVARVESVLTEVVPEERMCAIEACNAGTCGVAPPPDASTDSARVDAGDHDAGTDAGPTWVDAARDAGPLLRPFLPCGSTWEEDASVYFEVESGSISRSAVQHTDGICTGCFDEVLRLASGTTIVARVAFAQAFSPLVVRESGAGVARIEVCGESYDCDLDASGTTGFQNVPFDGCSGPPTVVDAGECEVRITAVGGVVAFRRFDLDCRLATSAPVVTVSVDGLETITRSAPASALLTWAASQSIACIGSGNGWSGPQHTSGSVLMEGLIPGTFDLALECTGPTGMTGTDMARVVVVP